jgi:hypothetical protein
MVFTEEAMFYGTDAEFAANRIYRIDRRTYERRTMVPEVGGPVWYSRAVGRDLFFGVTAERCPSQREDAAELWRLNGDGEAERLAKFAKDHLPGTYFMPGALHFSNGPYSSAELYFHGVSLVGAENRTFRVVPSEAMG